MWFIVDFCNLSAVADAAEIMNAILTQQEMNAAQGSATSQIVLFGDGIIFCILKNSVDILY